MKICYFPLLALAGIDFTTGHLGWFFPGGENAHGRDVLEESA